MVNDKLIDYMIIEKEKRIYWNYFLSLESDLENLSRYIEFTNNNFQTYSIELARMLLSVCSEIDVIAKLLCNREDPLKQANNITDYCTILTDKIPVLCMLNVFLPKYGLKLTPWNNWQNQLTPDWWHGYNNVKHERNKNYEDANLQNILNSMSGLFLFLLYLYIDNSCLCKLYPTPKLFTLDDEYIDYRHEPAVFFSLPIKIPSL